MRSFAPAFTLLLCALLGQTQQNSISSPHCRNIPGSPGYPTASVWNELNATVSGRLVPVVPSAKYCDSLPTGACTDAEWTSSEFRGMIPGAMNEVNWEQGYDLNPPSLCLRNGTTCGQGDVPTHSVEAETVADVQAAVKFSAAHNLRLAVKSSGHDFLGRSTAPNSLLIRTANFQNISFTESFFVGSKDMGSAVTVGSGVHANTLYLQSKANSKILVSPAAATVCTAGGYVQGAGHSALSPTFGLAADNVLEFYLVVASGELLQVNSVSHPDLFYALRGGGAGSWGVIVSATFRTFPTFNTSSNVIVLIAQNETVATSLAAVHAQHIFDWDSVHAGQYFVLAKNSTASDSVYILGLNTYLPNISINESMALFSPFMEAAMALPGVFLELQNYTYGDINDALFQTDDSVGSNAVLGSRLLPASTYRDSPREVGEALVKLANSGATEVLGHLVAGGKVAENANISSAVHPAWRTAKTHVVLVNTWDDTATLPEINALRKRFQTTQLPILREIAGPNAGAYSNEADLLEPNFQTTFFGPDYARLSAIKKKYDPQDLFIVGAGVGSERWDEWGLCRI
ncbi:FAD-binding domain-containing protein [Mycena alexandri]|uniref:FAD-binding domain-containing protein n=1 Tax=Mycena alexandri TaxID=1745969 RepID=A0AAD6X7J2_9AGAR|nr:FAD-binding domain-containing protein [Mycena alexandri]